MYIHVDATPTLSFFWFVLPQVPLDKCKCIWMSLLYPFLVLYFSNQVQGHHLNDFRGCLSGVLLACILWVLRKKKNNNSGAHLLWWNTAEISLTALWASKRKKKPSLQAFPLCFASYTFTTFSFSRPGFTLLLCHRQAPAVIFMSHI